MKRGYSSKEPKESHCTYIRVWTRPAALAVGAVLFVIAVEGAHGVAALVALALILAAVHGERPS